ncbi:polysaccharide deacetylase family protein [Tuberibacillus sp. Marseille-P3662]|uniref:polysaccharide deacetylase family protein n=1 Tax=Tuberibacillus sp. Marseille-P3662 TaxID=1965358 RepID=UPI000A1C8333|nr:polysaccharide deacetylase family protein [Tuberibacillus sp. Marseille-P3662]
MTSRRVGSRNRTKRRLKRNVGISLAALLSIAFLVCYFAWNSASSSTKSEHEAIVKKISQVKPGKETKKLSTDSKSSERKVVYLTFDDGPSSVTDEILETLRKYRAKATFFMLAPHMKERPEVVKQIVKEGHGVGLHGVTHELGQFYRSKQTVLHEMNIAQKTLKNITGFRSNIVRVPYGSVPYLIQPFRKALKSHGYKIWDWNVDSDDWDLPGKAYVTNTIHQTQKLEQGGVRSIVLLHDTSNTAKYLPKLLDWLTNHGFQMKKIDASVPVMHFKCYDRCHRLKT